VTGGRRWVRRGRAARAAKVNALVAQARSRVGQDFEVRNPDVGELCDGALLLRLADAAEGRVTS
jgi:hypothetical protein